MTLNELMEFDHVVEVHNDGTVTDAPDDVYAPDLNDGELESTSPWTLLDGYSGQDRYSGPIMHDSEFIGGQMERDILAQPGYYVVVACYWTMDEDDDDNIEGWAVAYQEAPTNEVLQPDAYTHAFKTLFGIPPSKDDTPLCGAQLTDDYDFPATERPLCPSCDRIIATSKESKA